MATQTKRPNDYCRLRKRAEALVSTPSVRIHNSLEKYENSDQIRLFHELQVHQLELELQNEELNRVQANLEIERDRYFELYDLAPIGYCTLSAQGVILQANLTLANLLHIPRSALIAQHITQFIHRDDQDVYFHHRNAVFKSQKTQDCELRMLKHDGTMIWCRMEAYAALAKNPRTVRVMILDITEKKSIESFLQQSELHFRTLGNIGQALIWTTGLDNQCDYFNDTWREFTGRTMAQELGKGWLDGVHPEDLLICRDVQATAFEQQAPFSVEYRLKNRDGCYRWIVSQGTPRYDIQGQFLGYIGHCLDITQRKELEAELVGAKKAAESANLAKSAFLANMSHEIRTPLNGLLSMMQLLQLGELNQEQKSYVEMAIRSGQRLTRLLSDILDLSRIEAGLMPLANKAFVVADTFAAVKDSFTPLSIKTQIPLQITLAPEVPPILIGDEVRFRQILFNLVGNAMKFTDYGKVSVDISTLMPKSGEISNLLCIVSDTGIGIPQEKIGLLAQPFTQIATSYVRNVQGAGLGLSICKHLIQAMNGSLCIDSTEGEGSSFYLTLPFKIAGGMESLAEHVVQAIAVPARCLRILLVEDDEINRKAAKALLEKMGHTVETASNGLQAIDATQRNVYDCILMDIQMDVMDGVESTQIIRKNASETSAPYLPIIALTGYAMADESDRFLEAGMDACISKPFEMDKIRDILSRVCPA